MKPKQKTRRLTDQAAVFDVSIRGIRREVASPLFKKLRGDAELRITPKNTLGSRTQMKPGMTVQKRNKNRMSCKHPFKYFFFQENPFHIQSDDKQYNTAS